MTRTLWRHDIPRRVQLEQLAEQMRRRNLTKGSGCKTRLRAIQRRTGVDPLAAARTAR
jgi:hypothetical protein